MASAEPPAHYRRAYSPFALFRKLGHMGRSMGKGLMLQALTLYYTAQSPTTPTWCKPVIYGALGYLISIIDGIPDFTPMLGYTDDMAVLVAAMATLVAHIRPEHRAQAEQRLQRILGKKDTSAT